MPPTTTAGAVDAHTTPSQEEQPSSTELGSKHSSLLSRTRKRSKNRIVPESAAAKEASTGTAEGSSSDATHTIDLAVSNSKLLRTAINSREGAGLSPSMRRLWYLLLLVCVVCCITVIFSYVYLGVSFHLIFLLLLLLLTMMPRLQMVFNEFETKLTFVDAAAARVFHSVSILYATQWLTLMAVGIAPEAESVAKNM